MGKLFYSKTLSVDYELLYFKKFPVTSKQNENQ